MDIKAKFDSLITRSRPNLKLAPTETPRTLTDRQALVLEGLNNESFFKALMEELTDMADLQSSSRTSSYHQTSTMMPTFLDGMEKGIRLVQDHLTKLRQPVD